MCIDKKKKMSVHTRLTKVENKNKIGPTMSMKWKNPLSIDLTILQYSNCGPRNSDVSP